MKDLKQNNVKLLLRCCEESYRDEELKKNNIRVEVSKFPFKMFYRS
jgi:hypothetical protein